jgi:DNA-binding NarL/FixJ family response regulator
LRVRILLVERHKILRDTLHALIAQQPDMQVVAEAEDGQSALQLAGRFKPDVVVMDISLHDMTGTDALRRIRDRSPDSRLIVLSNYASRHFAGEFFKAGASGYLLKDCAFEELVDAIRTVGDKRIYLSPGIATPRMLIP